jgi:hypothetical protein
VVSVVVYPVLSTCTHCAFTMLRVDMGHDVSISCSIRRDIRTTFPRWSGPSPRSFLPSFLCILLEPPAPRVVQPQRVLPRLRLAAQTLLLAIAVDVVAAEELGALFFLAEERAQDAARAAAEGAAERAGDAFLEGRADGAQAGLENFACGGVRRAGGVRSGRRVVDGCRVSSVWCAVHVQTESESPLHAL